MPRTPLTPRADRSYDTAAQFYDFAPAMYVLLDGSGLVVDVNQTGCRMLGVKRAAIIGSPLRTWIAAGDRRTFLEHVRRCRAEQHVVETAVQLQAHDGGVVAVRLYSRGLQTGGRRFFPTVAVDLTELRSLERARQAAEREREQAEHDRAFAQAADAAKDRLIALVSHELRNPLNPALVAANGLAMAPGLPDHARHLAAVIKRNIELEARLIGDLLDIARVTRGQLELQFETTDLHEILVDAMSACAPAAHARSVSLSVDLQAWSHYVHGDTARLRQVFWNLLSNAVKFSEPGGSALIRTANEIASGVETVRTTIRDRGVGMTRETVTTLFTPFGHATEKSGLRGGLGLGLAIAKSIVDGHDGRLTVSSDGLGLGSTVDIALRTSTASPTTRRSDAVVEHASTSPSEGERRRRVLIVEDHADTGAMLSLFLSQHECDVTVAQTLVDGLGLLGRGWDVVLSDIGLADGSGLEIGRQVALLPARPSKVIALSGYGSVNDIGNSLHAGFDDHLVKPIDLQQLLHLMEE